MDKIYRTDNLALAPYLQMNGLKYLKAEPSFGKNDKAKIEFLFEDPKGMGKDLELDFMRSEFKEYRSLFFFFRNEIEKLNRDLRRLRLEEERRTDDKYYEGNNEK